MKEGLWRRAWRPTPVFLHGESLWTEAPSGLQSTRSQRVGHDLSVLASTKLQVDLSAHLFESSIDFTLCSVFLVEGNGTPLQYSCLENPMDGGAW